MYDGIGLREAERAIIVGVFKAIYQHALTQKESAQDRVRGCVYRLYRDDSGDEPLKCFIGAVIKDKYYRTHLESSTLSSSAVQIAVQRSLGLEEPLSMCFMRVLNRLQKIHDKNPPEEWRELLMQEAECWEDFLEVPVLRARLINLEQKMEEEGIYERV